MENIQDKSQELPNDAVVVRGGRSSAQQIEQSRFLCNDYNFGIAVVSSHVVPFEILCEFIPHDMVRTTTVGEIRAAGGDVVASCGRGPNYAVLIGISVDDITLVTRQFDNHSGDFSMQDETHPQHSVPRVFADFHNADRMGRVRLNTEGAKQDLLNKKIVLYHGLQLELYDGELVTVGTVRHDDVEGWVVEIDWSAIM